MSVRFDAKSYDSWFDSPWGRYAFSIEADLVEKALGSLEDRNILDVGSGTGRFTIALRQQSAAVFECDMDIEMLRAASKKSCAARIACDAAALPFADRSFDITLANTLLEFVADSEIVLEELLRVTRRGGVVAIGALNPHSPWGIAHRREIYEQPWRGATLRNPRNLEKLIEPYGKVAIRSALFSPGYLRWAQPLATSLEHLGSMLSPRHGAFMVATIEVP